jgi:hypothetical protein
MARRPRAAGPVERLDGLGALLGRRLHQSPGALVVGAANAEGLAPVEDRGRAGAPPEFNGSCRFMTDRSRQFLIDE